MEYRIEKTVLGFNIQAKAKYESGIFKKKIEERWCAVNEHGKPITESNRFGIKPPNHKMNPLPTLEDATNKIQDILDSRAIYKVIIEEVKL